MSSIFSFPLQSLTCRMQEDDDEEEDEMCAYCLRVLSAVVVAPWHPNSLSVDCIDSPVALAGRIQGLRAALDSLVGNRAVIEKLLNLFRVGFSRSPSTIYGAPQHSTNRSHVRVSTRAGKRIHRKLGLFCSQCQSLARLCMHLSVI